MGVEASSDDFAVTPELYISNTYELVYIPTRFRTRLFVFILSTWVFIAAMGISCIIIPLVLTQQMFKSPLQAYIRTDSIYIFSIGLYTLGTLAAYAIHNLSSLYSKFRIEVKALAAPAVEGSKKTRKIFTLPLDTYVYLIIHSGRGNCFPPIIRRFWRGTNVGSLLRAFLILLFMLVVIIRPHAAANPEISDKQVGLQADAVNPLRFQATIWIILLTCLAMEMFLPWNLETRYERHFTGRKLSKFDPAVPQQQHNHSTRQVADYVALLSIFLPIIFPLFFILFPSVADLDDASALSVSRVP